MKRFFVKLVSLMVFTQACGLKGRKIAESSKNFTEADATSLTEARMNISREVEAFFPVSSEQRWTTNLLAKGEIEVLFKIEVESESADYRFGLEYRSFDVENARIIDLAELVKSAKKGIWENRPQADGEKRERLVSDAIDIEVLKAGLLLKFTDKKIVTKVQKLKSKTALFYEVNFTSKPPSSKKTKVEIKIE